MSFDNILKDIKELKIQGAENIAKEAVKAIKSEILRSKQKNNALFISELLIKKKKLENARPTEPCLRNAMSFLFSEDYLFTSPNIEVRELKEILLEKAQKVLQHFEFAKKQINEFGSLKVKDGMIIYTHCHSSTVIEILKRAKENKKKFEVHCTETRPKFQGRKTAQDLINLNISTTLYVDSAFRLAMKKADFVLLGADAITTEGKVINKIGSEVIAEIAHTLGVQVYCCADSWKFDPETVYGVEEQIEERDKNEIWPNHPKKLRIKNYAFEKIDPILITGIISELGIYSPQIFIEEVKSNYPWMFKNIKKS